jgi:hypothetical protein
MKIKLHLQPSAFSLRPFLFALAAVALLATAVCWWVHDAPRRQSLASLARLDNALHSANRAELLDLIVLPAAVRDRTAPEQSEFLAKALNDEISPAGLAALKQHGTYGPLKKLFPAEAEGWAQQAGVNPDDCVAFKLDRHGLRAEVVLVRSAEFGVRNAKGQTEYRVLRLNNVKQMADSNH